MPKRDRAAYMRAYRARRKKKAPRRRARKTAQDPAAAVAAWATATLQVPAGLLRGQPFALADWQVDWLRGALASGIREAGLSVARKNGKSGLVAALVLAHLVGPLRRPAWRAVVCSLTGNLAKELRRQVEEIARASGLYDAEAAAASRPPTGERIASYQTPQPGRIVGPDGDVTCLAADKATGHAVGADLAIVDEAGLLQGKAPRLVECDAVVHERPCGPAAGDQHPGRRPDVHGAGRAGSGPGGALGRVRGA